MAEPKQNMSQPTTEEHGNIRELSSVNSSVSLFLKTVCHVGTRPVNLVVYGITWFHLYSLCQFGRLHKNIPVLLACLIWWIGVMTYGLYLWICFNRKVLPDDSWDVISAIKAEDVKWYIRRKGYYQLFMKNKSVITANIQGLDREEQDFLDLKLSIVNALGKRKYRLAAGIFLAIVTVYGSVLVVKSAIPYNGELSWYLKELEDKRSVTLVHDNIYESGVEGILKDIRDKVKLPEKLCLATSFNLHFTSDGRIRTLDTMLYGFDENGDFVDSYLITYNAARSKKIDIYLGGSAGAVFDIDKDFKPLVEAVSVMPLKETVAEWSGQESYGILYYGMREWFSSEGIRHLNYRGESRLPSAEEFYFSGYSVSVFCPDDEAIQPVRYMYVGYQDFSEEEAGYVADYYPEESFGHMTNGDSANEAGELTNYVAEAKELLQRYPQYAEVLKQIMTEYTDQNGRKYDYDGFFDFENNTFAILDVDGDGRQELIFNFNASYIGAMCEVVYDYDTEKGILREELATRWVDTTYYNNGFVKVSDSHNHGHDPEARGVWPYTLYLYDESTDSYQLQYDVTSWDGQINSENFPGELDTDGDGLLYYILEDGKTTEDADVRPMNRQEYDNWVRETLPEWSVMDVTYYHMTEGIFGDKVQDKLDEERIIEEQSFQVELNDWGEVRFVSYEPGSSKRDLREDVTFYLLKDDEILYQFPYIGEGRISNHLYWDVKFIMFTDTNADGKKDIVIGAEYMTGAGPQGAIPHVVVRIYEDYGDYFTYNEELSDKINEYLPWESNVLAKDIKRLIQTINGNEPLTNYESYSGKWTVAPGYVVAYENPMPESGNELMCSISNGNEFYGNLFIEQEMTGRIASVEDIGGTIQNGELFFDFTDDGWGGTGTLHIIFLPNQINVEVLNHQIAEENAIGYGISGIYEMNIREE